MKFDRPKSARRACKSSSISIFGWFGPLLVQYYSAIDLTYAAEVTVHNVVVMQVAKALQNFQTLGCPASIGCSSRIIIDHRTSM